MAFRRFDPFVGGRHSTVLGRTVDRDGRVHLHDLLLDEPVDLIFDGMISDRSAVHQALIVAKDPRLVMQLDEKSRIYDVCRNTDRYGPGIVELCAGTGAMGTAAVFMGGQVLLSWDRSPLAVRHLESNGHGKTICADLDDLEALSHAHELTVGSPHTAFVGFPCQPYSRQGHMNGSTDIRASTLLSALRNLAVLGSQAVIMECVPGAGSDRSVQSQLDAFCHIMGFRRQETVLELSEQWPMQRSRWWTVMAPEPWSKFTLRSWATSMKRPTVGSILPSWGKWPLHHEQELLPDQREFSDYADKRLGKDKRIIEACDSCPTMLHSYGAVHRPCPCGCRTSPLSHDMLKTKGLRGYMVRSRVTNLPRFMHPKEAAALMTIPVNMNFEPPMRDALCLIGNAAPPLQCLWILTHLMMGVARHVRNVGFIRPEHAMTAYKQEMKRQIEKHFPDTVMPMQWLEIDAADDTKLRIYCHGSNTIASLLEAEHITLDWGHSHVMREGELLLPPELELSQVSGCSASLEHRVKRQCLTKPVGPLVIAIVHQDQHLMEIVDAGAFLFEALRKLDLMDVIWVVDETGALYSADYRIWESHRFHTLPPDAFPTLKIGCHMDHKANGKIDGKTGLSLSLITKLTRELCAQVLQDDHKQLLIPPIWMSPNVQMDSLLGQQWLNEVWEASNKKLILPVAANQHWILLCAQQSGEDLRWQCYDGWNLEIISPIRRLIRYVSKCLNLKPMAKLVNLVTQKEPTTCGTILIAHLCHHLALPGQFNEKQIVMLHSWLF